MKCAVCSDECERQRLPSGDSICMACIRWVASCLNDLVPMGHPRSAEIISSVTRRAPMTVNEAYAAICAALAVQRERLLRGDKLADVEAEYRDAVSIAVPVVMAAQECL